MSDSGDDTSTGQADVDDHSDVKSHGHVRNDTGGTTAQNPARVSFWLRSGDVASGVGDNNAEVEMDGHPGGRTPQSLAQDQWEELPLIKDGILGKVRLVLASSFCEGIHNACLLLALCLYVLVQYLSMDSIWYLQT